MKIAAPETLFGLSRALTDVEANDLETFLVAAWVAQFGRAPGHLESDLVALKRFFLPTATGRRLRTEVARLRAITSPQPRSASSQVFLSTSGARGLVTPEGRVLLEVLKNHAADTRIAVHTDEIAWAYRMVADAYRDWGRNRVLEALGLKEGALRIPVIAFNLFLIVNGTIGRDHALQIPDDEDKEADLSSIIGTLLDTFDRYLRKDRRKNEAFRLRGGWIVTETSRHLFDFVSFEASLIWVHPGKTDALVKRLAAELARQRQIGSDTLGAAFDQLVHAYAEARPALASRGVAHERAAATRAVRNRLLGEFGELRLEPITP